jgi:hypothetical protein
LCNGLAAKIVDSLFQYVMFLNIGSLSDVAEWVLAPPLANIIFVVAVNRGEEEEEEEVVLFLMVVVVVMHRTMEFNNIIM